MDGQTQAFIELLVAAKNSKLPPSTHWEVLFLRYENACHVFNLIQPIPAITSPPLQSVDKLLLMRLQCNPWTHFFHGVGSPCFTHAHHISIDLFHKSHAAPAPYPTMHHSEQKCAHFCSEWCIVEYGAGALWDFWNWPMILLVYGWVHTNILDPFGARLWVSSHKHPWSFWSMGEFTQTSHISNEHIIWGLT